MEIEKLWEGIKTKDCTTCNNEDCNGRLNYNSLCANINYLKEYGEKNFKKNKETFAELKKLMGSEKPAVFSFGCGIGLDYVGATESFGSNLTYYPIDECKWAIMETDNYKKFEPKLPKRIMSLDEGMMLLTMTPRNAVVSFFNSLFSISKNTPNLKQKLIKTLQTKNNFYFVCDYTVNNNFHMPTAEQEFISELIGELKHKFSFKEIDILDDKGIIISGQRK